MERGVSAISYQLSALGASLKFSTAFRVIVLRLLRLKCILAISVLMFTSSHMFGQVQYPTTADSPLYATNQPCTSGVACWPAGQPPFAQIGNSVNFDLPYTNSGAFKLEVSGNQMLTWVTDYERNDFYTPVVDRASISHWDASSSTATNPPTLLQGNGPDQIELDPDVVQMEDELFAVYYSILPTGTFGFPGNGSVSTDEFRVFFDRFTATDPPVLISSTMIQEELLTPADVLYAKNPNIDVSVNDQIAMTWEEQNTAESTNHVYARTYDTGTGLSAVPFDLDPTDFDYENFYNPDIACSFGADISLTNDDQPVYITFVGVSLDGNFDLLVYHATYGEIRTAAAPNAANLKVVDVLNTDATLSIGNHLKDYLSRPRIAARPVIYYIPNTSIFNDQYNIVVPELSFDYQYGTNINGYVPTTSSYNKTIYTQTSSSSADIDCHVNYEPCTDVNNDGYEIVWNADEHALWPGLSPNAPSTVNPLCFPFGSSFYEQTILRKKANILGNATYTDYSVVPDNLHHCCWTYSPSVAYDRFEILGISSGSTSNYTFFGFQHDIYDQNTFYKLSDHLNVSLKKEPSSRFADKDETLNDNVELMRLSPNTYQLNTNAAFDDTRLTDVHGRLLSSHITQGHQSLRVDLNSLPSGIYFLSTFNNGQPSTYKLQSIH